jgi:hypothetical protein
MLRDDQIVEILELVDFRITKSELGAFFRDEKHENYMECGDLRNFLNGLVFICGTKKETLKPKDVLAKHKAQIPAKDGAKKDLNLKLNQEMRKSRGDKVLQNKSATKNLQKKTTKE